MSTHTALTAIVDDDESVCRAIKRLVTSLGMEADTFTSGQAFIERMQAMTARHVDCVILDVQMPEMSGLEVQRRMALLGKPIPIIFITAHDDLAARDQALGAGAIAFLHKPFDDELLITTLGTALKESEIEPIT